MQVRKSCCRLHTDEEKQYFLNGHYKIRMFSHDTVNNNHNDDC